MYVPHSTIAAAIETDPNAMEKLERLMQTGAPGELVVGGKVYVIEPSRAWVLWRKREESQSERTASSQRGTVS